MFGLFNYFLYSCARSFIIYKYLFRININNNNSQKKIYFCLLFKKVLYICTNKIKQY